MRSHLLGGATAGRVAEPGAHTIVEPRRICFPLRLREFDTHRWNLARQGRVVGGPSVACQPQSWNALEPASRRHAGCRGAGGMTQLRGGIGHDNGAVAVAGAEGLADGSWIEQQPSNRGPMKFFLLFQMQILSYSILSV